MIRALRILKRKTRVRTRARIVIAKAKTTLYIYKTDGLRGVFAHVKSAVKKRIHKLDIHPKNEATDVLFVTIDDPLLERYRTSHMMEELQSTGVTVDKVYYYNLTVEHAKRYTTFIFYRCPWLPEFEAFFKEARKHNKVLIHTVDDLVIDTKYTDSIPTIQELDADERAFYDEGVNRHKKTMEYCDYAITTTLDLANELKNYKNLKEVFINRNAMSDEMVYWANKAIDKITIEDEKVIIGYFSGTTTHNEDFQLVAPALVRILKKHKNAYVKLAGRIDAPEQLKEFKDRLIFTPYVDWRKLPFELRKCTIILAPLIDTVFNRAKSEIKWTESALVGVPVVASNMGSFQEAVQHRETGLLADNTSEAWFDALDELITNKALYKKIAKQSRDQVLANCRTTGKNATELKSILKKITPPVIAFAGVNLGALSGGNMVVKKHMDILREAGNIVYGVENMDYHENDKWLAFNKEDDKTYDIFRVSSHRKEDKINLQLSFDRFVATFWGSVDTVDAYQYMNGDSKKLYLVQNMEAGFYEEVDPVRIQALATYSNHRLEPITISEWCQSWLSSEFGREAKYAPNGISIDKFPYSERNWKNRKIKVLIEGDSASEYKRVDESFTIANRLDKDKYEISYMSYNAEPKDWYEVDNVYLQVPYGKVGEVYAQHDILIKSSLLESFSYPPLEIMATGGVPVLVKNDGNAEYIVDNQNALYYEIENIDDALLKIETLANNCDNFKQLATLGRSTSEKRAWSKVSADILALYE